MEDCTILDIKNLIHFPSCSSDARLYIKDIIDYNVKIINNRCFVSDIAFGKNYTTGMPYLNIVINELENKFAIYISLEMTFENFNCSVVYSTRGNNYDTRKSLIYGYDSAKISDLLEDIFNRENLGIDYVSKYFI